MILTFTKADQLEATQDLLRFFGMQVPLPTQFFRFLTVAKHADAEASQRRHSITKATIDDFSYPSVDEEHYLDELEEARSVPMRDFIYDKFYLREIVSITVSPGGIGKSTLVLTEALAMASCKSLLGVEMMFQSRVWYWNGEDTRAELMRRFAGAAKYYRLDQSDFAHSLFVDSGHDVQIVVAETAKDGTKINAPVIENLVRVIREKKLDVVIIDPFISSHNVPENDNSTIDSVIKLYGRIAAQEGISIMLVHHSRKLNGKEGTGDDIRGGGAIRDAVRSARILHPMNESEARKYGIDDHTSYFYATDDKQNFAKRSSDRQFYRMESVCIGNGLFGENHGDYVGVVNRWHPAKTSTELTEEQLQAIQHKLGMRSFRFNAQSPAWVGHDVAHALGMNMAEDGCKQIITHLLNEWVLRGAIERYYDEFNGQKRPMGRFIDYDKLT